MIGAGSKVVCINDRFPIQILEWARCIPCAGCVYTVSRIKHVPDGVTGILGPAYELKEIDNRGSNGRQIGFSVWRFREATLEECDAATAADGAPSSLRAIPVNTSGVRSPCLMEAEVLASHATADRRWCQGEPPARK